LKCVFLIVLSALYAFGKLCVPFYSFVCIICYNVSMQVGAKGVGKDEGEMVIVEAVVVEVKVYMVLIMD